MSRKRLTDNRKASAPPATPGYLEYWQKKDEIHPAATQQDPGAHDYENGDTSSWAEDPHPGPYAQGPHPATPWEGPANPQTTKPDHNQGVTLSPYTSENGGAGKQAIEKKAARCVRIASQMLGKEASPQAIEDQALSLMDLPNATIEDTLRRMNAGGFMVGNGCDSYDELDYLVEDESYGDDPYGEDDLLEDSMSDMSMYANVDHMASQDRFATLEKELHRLHGEIAMLRKQAEDQNDPDAYEFGDTQEVSKSAMHGDMYSMDDEMDDLLLAQMMEEMGSDDEDEDEDDAQMAAMLKEMSMEEEGDMYGMEEEMRMLQAMIQESQSSKQAGEEEEEEEEEESEEEESKEEDSEEESEESDKEASMILAEDPMGDLLNDNSYDLNGDQFLSQLYTDKFASEDEDEDDEEEKEAAKKSAKKAEEDEEEEIELEEKASNKKASLKPKARLASNGATTLGQVSRVASDQNSIDGLSKLWESSPDVTGVFK